MRPRLAALAALIAALAAAGLLARVRRRETARLAAERAAAVRAHDAAAAVDACLFGAPGLPDRDLAARARRVALHPDTAAAWPGACAPHVRALAAASPANAAAAALLRALGDAALPAAITAFREGAGEGAAFAWVPRAVELRRADRAHAASRGLGPARAPRVPEAHALASTAGDVVPASVAPGATVAGWSASAGTLSVLFVEPSHERVFCRSRDRGVTVACRRLGAGDDAPSWLVGNDGPEALLLRGLPTASVAPADAPDAPVFIVGRALAASLPVRVAGDVFHAVAEGPGAPALARCVRGGACAFTPLGVPAQRESAILSTGRARWWVGVAGPDATPSLDARRLDDAAPAPAVRVTGLSSTGALLASCHAPGVAYVAVTDGARAHLVVAEGDAAPRLVGSFDAVTPPAELACDASGAALVGASRAQGCERGGDCPPSVALEGLARAVRVGGELVAVWATRDGGDGLRARHGAPRAFSSARAFAVDDDAAHGGLSARDLWLFAVDDRVVLFASGATTAVLWSDDRGERWHSAREPVEVRPMRLGRVR
ncbi:MAG: hypothetical protein U0324_11180 [Polyangiales bacterium]